MIVEGVFDMRMYIAGFKDKRITIQAESLYAARVEAEKQFKPKKKDMGLLWVELADVEHTPTF